MRPMEDKQVPDFHDEGMQPPVPSEGWQMIKNAETFLCFLK